MQMGSSQVIQFDAEDNSIYLYMRRSPWAHHHGASAQFFRFLFFFLGGGAGLVPGTIAMGNSDASDATHHIVFLEGR